MIQFSRAERRDLLVAWLVLGVAFTLFIGRPEVVTVPAVALELFAVCLATAGVGFLVHEVAHKAVAVHFGRSAAFRADYRLLVLTLVSGAAGFLFAAPGAVYHRGRPDPRIHGLVAVAGPVSNLLLLAVFVPLWFAPVDLLTTVGAFGVWINALLAAFNMLPIGPLDGRTVWRWHRGVYVLVAAFAAVAAAWAFASVGLLPV